MMLVHRENDAAPRVDLAPLAKEDGAFAIGPLAGLRGEITALDGKIHTSRVVDGAPVITSEWDVQAPFLVHGHVLQWDVVNLPAGVQTLADLARVLPELAREANLDTKAPFPFKVHVEKGKLDYHIMNNLEDGFAIQRPHAELMARFTIDARPATLIGVYSTGHAGIFTHHGETTHIHVVSDDGRDAGHVDGATLGENAKLFLPKR